MIVSMLQMAHNQLLALITEVDRLITAGAESATRHERLTSRYRAVEKLSRQVPALEVLLPLIQAVLDAKKADVSSALLNLQNRIRQLRANLATPGTEEGNLEPITESGPWETTTPLRDLVAEVNQIRTSRAHRLRIIKGIEKMSPDLRLVGALMHIVDHDPPYIADAVADELLPQLGRMILPELTDRPILKHDLAGLRRLIALTKIDPIAAEQWITEVEPELLENVNREQPRNKKKS